MYFVGNTYNRVYISCCKYGENRYCIRCANKKVCASKHTGLLNSCLEKLSLHPYLVVPLISARITLISTRVSAHCQANLLLRYVPNIWYIETSLSSVHNQTPYIYIYIYILFNYHPSKSNRIVWHRRVVNAFCLEDKPSEMYILVAKLYAVNNSEMCDT